MRATSIPQLSLAYVATSLRHAGVEVELLDAVAEARSTADLIAGFRARTPDLLVANTVTPTIENDRRVLGEIKAALPSLPIVVFGAHATTLHEALLRENPWLDAVARGEPELTIRELAERAQRGESWSGTPGATVRDPDAPEGFVVGPERPLLQKLDELGWPARDLLPHHHYVHPVFDEPYTTVNVGRGCPQECTFCVAPIYYGRPIRVRTPDDVVREIREDVIGRHGIRNCWFYADDLTAHEDYLTRLCQRIIDSGLKIRWWGNTRADVQNQELFDLMAKAGCFMLSIGGESGVDDILRRAKKNIVKEDITATVEMLRKAGIVSLVYFLVGLPGETSETVEQTLAFAREANADYVEFYPATPYPGTELERQAEEGDLIVDRNWDNYECGGTKFVVRVDGMSREELDVRLRQAYRSYYLRWGYVRPRILRELGRPRRLGKLARFGLRYFKRLATQR